jgi:hypothetical protein
MRAIAFVAAGLALCASAYACGGASDAFVPTSSDGGVDGTAPGAGTGNGDTGAGDPGTGDAGGAGVTPDLDGGGTGEGQAPTSDDATTAPSDGGPGPAADGGPIGDSAAPDGPVPDRIACGATTCSTSGQFCCAQLDGGASCQSSEQACMALIGVQRQCEKTADCPANNVCCYEFSSIPATTSCHANDCNGGNGMRVEACRSQSDCTTGTCATRTCVAGGSIQSCAAFGAECP